MAVSRKSKEVQLDKIQLLVDQACAITIAENKGITSNEMTALRKNARENNVVLMVAKNTIAKRVLKDNALFGAVYDDLNSPVMLGFSLSELSSGAKLLGNYAKINKKLVVKSVAIEGVRYDQSQIEYVMNLPTREQAIAMVAMGIQSPLVQFTGVLQEIYGQFSRVLHAVAEQKKD